MEELKPCPFCGLRNVALTKPTKKSAVGTAFSKKYYGKLRCVVCLDCGCNGGIFNTLALTEEQAEDKAVNSWNRRTSDEN